MSVCQKTKQLSQQSILVFIPIVIFLMWLSDLYEICIGLYTVCISDCGQYPTQLWCNKIPVYFLLFPLG